MMIAILLLNNGAAGGQMKIARSSLLALLVFTSFIQMGCNNKYMEYTPAQFYDSNDNIITSTRPPLIPADHIDPYNLPDSILIDHR